MRITLIATVLALLTTTQVLAASLKTEAPMITFTEVKAIKNKLDQAKKLSEEKKFSPADKILKKEIESLGDRYVDEKVLDDTGIKLTLANQKEKEKDLETAFHLFYNVLSDRLNLLQNKLPSLLSLWSHGGEPGTPSVKLVIQKKEAKFVAVVTNNGVSYPTYIFPENMGEEFLDKTLESPLFKEKPPVSKDFKVADVMVEEWEMSSSQKTLTTKFEEPFPKSLNKIRKVIHDLIDHVSEGKVNSLDDFREHLNAQLTAADAKKIFGEPARDLGSGLYIYEYPVLEGGKVTLSFGVQLMSAKYSKNTSEVETLFPAPEK